MSFLGSILRCTLNRGQIHTLLQKHFLSKCPNLKQNRFITDFNKNSSKNQFSSGSIFSKYSSNCVRSSTLKEIPHQRYFKLNIRLYSVLKNKNRILENKRPVECIWRRISRRSAQASKKNKTVVLYVVALTVLIGGLSYAAVPLYAVFCQATGLGGQATKGHDTEKVESMMVVKNRQLLVKFNADTAASMRWNFRPQQPEVKLYPGETALAFYSAFNPTDKPIVGISTYNVVPFEAGQYFNKIQCFCFEEQRLNPHEQVDMPVFFYIDPEFAEDPRMEKVDLITLSYTFFEAKEGLELPDPWMKH